MDNPKPPLISVVIVSYNTRQMTLDCLASLKKRIAEANIKSEVFLVDNDSQDGTCGAVETQFPEVILIANKQNVGFGTANNQAMTKAFGRYFLLLNSDAFLETEALPKLINFLEKNSSLGVVGPYLLNEDGSHQDSIHTFNSPKLAWKQFIGLDKVLKSSTTSNQVDEDSYLKGACLLIRREVYDSVGGFDETFFFYGEESDWQKRIIDSGFKLGFVEEAKVTHLEGKSGNKQRLRASILYFVGMDYFIYKHFAGFGFYSYRFGVMLWCFRKLMICGLIRLRRGRNEFAEKMYGFLLRHIFSSPATIKADALKVKELQS